MSELWCMWALTSLVVALGGISSPHTMVDHSGIVVSTKDGQVGRFHLFQPFVVEMELSLLLLEALDEWGVSPLLVLAITVHEVATTLC